MHILLLAPQLPFPAHQGTTIRNFNLIARLAERHTVRLICFGPLEQPVPLPLARLCERVTVVPVPALRRTRQRLQETLLSPLPDMGLRLQSEAMLKAVREALPVGHSAYDVVQVEGIELAYTLSLLRQRVAAGTLIVFDDHNAEYVLQQRAFQSDLSRPQRWPGAIYSLFQWRKLRRYERAACLFSDRVIVCSQADQAALARLLPGKPAWIVPNGVDLAYYHPDCCVPAALESPALVFTGKMDFRPNVDGVLWFVEQVWPQVRAAWPGASFTIVGQAPHPRIQVLNGRDGIGVSGAVADVRPYLAGADLVVIPLRIGGGTRLKLLEALAMGRAVLSTRLGAEGFPVSDGRELALANSARDFARRAVTLLADPAERARLGATGRGFAEAHYGWEAVVAAMEQIYAHTG